MNFLNLQSSLPILLFPVRRRRNSMRKSVFRSPIYWSRLHFTIHIDTYQTNTDTHTNTNCVRTTAHVWINTSVINDWRQKKKKYSHRYPFALLKRNPPLRVYLLFAPSKKRFIRRRVKLMYVCKGSRFLLPYIWKIFTLL